MTQANITRWVFTSRICFGCLNVWRTTLRCSRYSFYFQFEISSFVNIANGFCANPSVHANASLWLILQAWRRAQRPFCLANKIHMASVFGLRTAWVPPLHASSIRNEKRVAPRPFSSSSPHVLSHASLSCFQLKNKRAETLAGKMMRAKLFFFALQLRCKPRWRDEREQGRAVAPSLQATRLKKRPNIKRQTCRSSFMTVFHEFYAEFTLLMYRQ